MMRGGWLEYIIDGEADATGEDFNISMQLQLVVQRCNFLGPS